MRIEWLYLAALLAIAPGAHAAVEIDARYNGEPLTCAQATGVSYELANNTLRFTCVTTGLDYVCQPSEPGISYQLPATSGNPRLVFSCVTAVASGLIVEARIDVTHRVDVCLDSSNITYRRVASGNFRFDWTCNGTEQRSCFPTSPIDYRLAERRIRLSCDSVDDFFFTDEFE